MKRVLALCTGNSGAKISISLLPFANMRKRHARLFSTPWIVNIDPWMILRKHPELKKSKCKSFEGSATKFLELFLLNWYERWFKGYR
jgi:hypothetical protein